MRADVGGNRGDKWRSSHSGRAIHLNRFAYVGGGKGRRGRGEGSGTGGYRAIDETESISECPLALHIDHYLADISVLLLAI